MREPCIEAGETPAATKQMQTRCPGLRSQGDDVASDLNAQAVSPLLSSACD